MLKGVKVVENERKQVTGVFVRYGTKNGYTGVEKTLLFKDIKDLKGNLISSNVWLNSTKGLEDLGELKEGELLTFTVRCKKGYTQYRTKRNKTNEKEYVLSHPLKISKLNEG